MADIEWTLLARYAAGECTADERAEVERWLVAAPANAAQLTAMREVAALGDRANSAEERARTLAQVRQKAARTAAATRPPGLFAGPHPVRRVLRVAAVLVGALGTSLLGYQLLRDQPSSAVTDALSFRTFTTPRGGRLSVRLPDGTLAELAPATTLRLPATYGRRDRAVELVGQAVFTVTHDAGRPFTVHTARLVARDLGTRFVVREYPDDTAADVVVAEGTVAVTHSPSTVSRASDSVVLGRGERARTTADNRLVMTRNVPLEGYFGWTEGRLVFRGALLRDAAAQIGRWYDVDVRLASPEIAAFRFSASFEYTETAPAVLQVIANALNLHLVRTDRVYTLRAK